MAELSEQQLKSAMMRANRQTSPLKKERVLRAALMRAVRDNFTPQQIAKARLEYKRAVAARKRADADKYERQAKAAFRAEIAEAES